MKRSIDKIIKTRDYFQNINMYNVSIKNIFYMQTTLKYLHGFLCGFYVLHLRKQIFMYQYEKIDMIKF